MLAELKKLSEDRKNLINKLINLILDKPTKQLLEEVLTMTNLLDTLEKNLENLGLKFHDLLDANLYNAIKVATKLADNCAICNHKIFRINGKFYFKKNNSTKLTFTEKKCNMCKHCGKYWGQPVCNFHDQNTGILLYDTCGCIK